jgi:tetratricopeptide (TPR) repeat protein
MVKISPAAQLFDSYRFKEAAEAYERQLREGPPNDLANMSGLGNSLMAAGEYAKAIPYLEKVSEDRKKSLPRSPGCDDQVAVCHWMVGDRVRAVDIIRNLVMGVRDRKIIYTDLAGGSSQGVILCYMAATLRLSPNVDLAISTGVSGIGRGQPRCFFLVRWHSPTP